MYMRLWWKDARQFWPVWAFLAVAATLIEGVVVYYAEPNVPRGGTLGALALCWTALYAVAVGAAAFAGERETGTLRLLDILPASRQAVWASKVSFAFGSTLALAAILLAIAALGSEPWGMGWNSRDLIGAIPLAGLLLEALVLGLFCSAIMGNALLAAVTSIGLMMLTWFGVLAMLDQFFGRGLQMHEYLVWHIGVILTAIIASYIGFTWPRRTRLGPLGIRFQSPIAVSWHGSARTRRAPAQTQPPVAPEGLTPAPVPVPIAFAASTVTARPWSADQPRPRSWFTEFRYLAWETMREGLRTWCYLLSFGLILPVAYFIAMNMLYSPVHDLTFDVPWNGLVALVAGVSVFGLENRARSYRFVVHHGARPGTVWLAKLMVWCFGLAIIWVPIITFSFGTGVGPPRMREELLRVAYFLPLAFAVAHLCGMVIPRGITAGVIAIVVTLGLAAAQFALLEGFMMPDWGLAALPVAFLLVTWAWSGDWLLDRPAPGRYLRLALILAATFGVVLGGYAGVRAWSIPDPGPIAAPIAWSATASLSPDRNAADLYREAASKRAAIDLKKQGLDDPDVREALDLIRRAAARPDCRFKTTERLNLLSLLDLPPIHELTNLVRRHAYDRLSRDDLAGAWDDIVVLIRMARHLSEGATMRHGLNALSIESEAMDLARDWATIPGQTPERLHAAIAAYRDLPRLTPVAEIVRGEAILLERTFDLPTDELQGPLLEMLVGPRYLTSGNVPLWASLYIDTITTPWERSRARRVNRQFASTLIQNASLEPWQQELGPRLPIAYDLRTAPLARYLESNTGACLGAEARNEVARRALVQVMAIRSWQLRHDGRFPDRLEQLVPDELSSLPNDPYSGEPFRYLPEAEADRLLGSEEFLPPAKPETRLLYSVGPDGQDNHGVTLNPNSSANDIVFPIPPLRIKAAAPAGQGREPAKPKEPAKAAPAKPALGAGL